MLQKTHMSYPKRTLFPVLIFLFSFLFNLGSQAQTVDDVVILVADKKYINTDYRGAIPMYKRFLKHHPEDFYVIRQVGRCYTYLSQPDEAIDYWTKVYENAKANDADRLEYARCLMGNYRTEEAKIVLNSLKNSKDPLASSWAKTYANAESFFYEDSALCRIYAINGFMSTQPEYVPYLYKSELVYITVPKKSFMQNMFGSAKRHHSSIYSTVRIDSVTWKKGKVFNPQIQGKNVNGPVCVTNGDSILYYTGTYSSSEAKKGGAVDGVLRTGIFYTEINENGLAHPEKKPLPLASPTCNVAYPSMNKAGNKIYFASDMSGSLGGYDIWVSEKKNGVWTKPENLGPHVNSIGNEIYPFITEDGVLYYASDGRPGMGCMDIFIADPSNESGKFLEAENAGAGINSKFNDAGIYVLADGKRGYFSSNRDKGGPDEDIYFFSNNKPRTFSTKFIVRDSAENKSVGADISVGSPLGTFGQRVDSGSVGRARIKPGQEINITVNSDAYLTKVITKIASANDTLFEINLEPRFQRAISGRIIDKETNTPIEGMKVGIYDEDGTNYLDILTDASGAYKASKLPLDKDLYIGAAKKPDYFSNTERFRITKGNDIVKDILTQKIVIGKAIKVENIYFDPSKFEVRDDAKPELDKLVTLMKDNPDIIIELSSHSDCKGPAPQNLLLSDKRAKASAAYIVSKGINKDRIKGKGYGETKLLNDCGCEGKVESKCSDEQHAMNRRTEFKVTGFVQEKKK